MKHTFESLQESTSKYNETGDCAVKACAVVLKTTYEDAHCLLASYGRNRREGTNFDTATLPALNSRGLNLERIFFRGKYRDCTNRGRLTLQSSPVIDSRFQYTLGWVRTVSNAEQVLKSGTFIIRTSGHIIALVDGKAICYSAGQSHRILAIYKVTGEPVQDLTAMIPTISYNKPVKTRKRQDKDNWELRRLDTEETVFTYKRKPNKIVRGLRFYDDNYGKLYGKFNYVKNGVSYKNIPLYLKEIR